MEVFDEDTYVEGYCNFPLRSLVGAPFEYTLQSLSLAQAQQPRWKLRDNDVIIAAETFPYITDLAIPRPDLEEIALLEGHIGSHLTLQFSILAVSAYVTLYFLINADKSQRVLNSFSHLKYLQLIADSRALREHSDNEDIQVEEMARQILDILSVQGLQLEFLTVALCNTEYPFDMGPDMCHLQVHQDPKQSTTTTIKAMRYDMINFGDLRYRHFPNLVQQKTGLQHEFMDDDQVR